jgi:hypothetical protein
LKCFVHLSYQNQKMKRLLIPLLALASCTKAPMSTPYKGDLINIRMESNSSSLYINSRMCVSNTSRLDSNFWLMPLDTIRIVCDRSNLSGNDTQFIRSTINFNKYYSAFYTNRLYDSVKACPSRSWIEYRDDTLIISIIYRYNS